MKSMFVDFCGSQFWDLNLTWNTNTPDFTPCFHQSLLRWIPTAWLLLCASYLVRQCYQTDRNNIFYFGRLLILKVISSIIIILNLLVEVALTFITSEKYSTIYTVSPIIQAVSVIVVLLFMIIQRKKCIFNSVSLFFFWFFSFICGSITLYSYIARDLRQNVFINESRFYCFIIYYFFVTLNFLSTWISDTPSCEVNEAERQPCPETRASFLSRITYWWINRLVLMGFRKNLVESDIFALNPRDECRRLIPKFQKYWKLQLLQSQSRKERQIKNSLRQSDKRMFNYDNRYKNENTPLLREYLSRYGAVDPQSDSPKRNNDYPSLLKVLSSVFGPNLLLSWICKLVCDIVQFVNPFLLKHFMEFIDDKRTPEWKGYFYAAIFFFSTIIVTILYHQMFFIAMTVGMQIKAVIISVVYKKALTLSNSNRKDFTTGEIMNLISVDAQRLQDVTSYLWALWSAPFQIIIALILLWKQVGPSALAGLMVMVILIPLNGYIAKVRRTIQLELMKRKDERIKVMNEILNGIKVIKFYAWEFYFQEKVLKIRENELKLLKKASYYGAVTIFSFTCAPFLITLATFTTYVISSEENQLTAAKVFTTLTLFNIIKIPVSLLPTVMTSVVMASASLKRISMFLNCDDFKYYVLALDKNDGSSIVIENASFTWENMAEIPTLRDISLRIKEGELIAFFGQVGCGKSSLISAILGEIDKICGRVMKKGTVAYVSQQAWIQNASIKDNILFGSEFDETRYQTVLNDCALDHDLKILPAGDMTEIGEKGINLSGGQRQRISLARAVYNNAEIYLLDDPLSAVDSNVGKHIFDHVIGPNGSLATKTRVLVTNGLHLLKQVDNIFILIDGKIAEQGSFDDLLMKQSTFCDFFRQNKKKEVEVHDKKNMIEEEYIESISDENFERFELLLNSGDESTIGSPRSFEIGYSSRSTPPSSNTSTFHKKRFLNTSIQTSHDQQNSVLFGKELKSQHEKLIENEKLETGRIKLSVLITYIRALQWNLTLAFIFSFLLFQISSVISSVWLSLWTADTNDYNRSLAVNATHALNRKTIYLVGYIVLGAAQVVFVLIYSIVTAKAFIVASRILHQSMLTNILRGTMSFFDTTPVGRIVNRFSRDIETLDAIIPQTFRTYLSAFFNVFSTLIVISYSTPLFLIVIGPLSLFYFFVQRFYIPSSRQLKRLESNTRSLIFNHISETISGILTIRAFNYQKIFIHEIQRRIDYNQIFYFGGMAVNRWLGLRLEIIGAFVVFFASVFAVLGRHTNLSGSFVGLSVTYALQVRSALNMMIRMTSDLENNIVSVERIEEYCNCEKEAEWNITEGQPPKEWPDNGAVEFDNFAVRYREGLDLVLRGITFNIKACEKIGVIGRTGAGKSSLTLCIFRILEAVSGRIMIDGRDISKMGLHQLRRKINILPQDPVIFSGSLRDNLDPLHEHTEDELWFVLEQSNISCYVKSLPEGLDFVCGDGGCNLSAGQRQLLCLARTMLRKNKILIFDEATSAIDFETDSLIQKSIRRVFNECTIITIAHRLNTVMENDRILVLDNGLITEFDTPKYLLDKKSSIFYGMACDANLL